MDPSVVLRLRYSLRRSLHRLGGRYPILKRSVRRLVKKILLRNSLSCLYRHSNLRDLLVELSQKLRGVHPFRSHKLRVMSSQKLPRVQLWYRLRHSNPRDPMVDQVHLQNNQLPGEIFRENLFRMRSQICIWELLTTLRNVLMKSKP